MAVTEVWHQENPIAHGKYLTCGLIQILINFSDIVPAVYSMNPNIKLTDHSGIMFAEKNDDEALCSRVLDQVSFLTIFPAFP